MLYPSIVWIFCDCALTCRHFPNRHSTGHNCRGHAEALRGEVPWEHGFFFGSWQQHHMNHPGCLPRRMVILIYQIRELNAHIGHRVGPECLS